MRRGTQLVLCLASILLGPLAAGPVFAQNSATGSASPLRSVLDPVDDPVAEGPPRSLAGSATRSGSISPDSPAGEDSSSALTGANPFMPPIPDSAPPGRSRTSPNYGRPRPLPDKRLQYPGRPRQSRRPLAPLQPYRSAPLSVRSSDPLSRPPPVQFAQPRQIARRARPRLEDNPYAPLGINLSSIRVLPFVEFTGGFDDNSGRSGGQPTGSSLARIDAGFTAFSLWSRHRFSADVRGGYVRYFADRNANRPDGSARVTLQLDATRDLAIDLEMRGTLTTQRPGSPEVNASVIGRPAIIAFGGTAGVRRRFGRVEARAAMLVDRTEYENGKLSSGNIVRLSRDNYTATGLRGRLSYEITPGLQPFAEVTVDMRRRDEPIDASGFSRNSSGVAVRAGSTFEISRILTGEASVGYASRKYADARLPSLHGATFDASLIWTATPLTTVTFRAQTTLNETTIAGAAGSISRTGSVQIDHALLRNLNLGATALWQNNNYQGISLTENVVTGTLRADYSLTRSVMIRGSYTHTRLKSSQAGADYTANVFLLGLRLQR